MHDAMLTATKPLKTPELIHLAKKLKINIPQFKRDLNNTAIHQQIAQNTRLTKQLGIDGAPTVIFVNSLLAHHPERVGDIPQYLQMGKLTQVKLDKLYDAAKRDS